MKGIVVSLLLVASVSVAGVAVAQTSSEEQAVMESIAIFFDAFAAQDGDKMMSVTDSTARLVITANDSTGQPVMQPVSMEQFVGFITRPRAEKVVETYWDPQVTVHDNLATVWMNYNLWVDDKVDHCGYDNFQLFRSKTGWKIIAIADTQRKEGCEAHDFSGVLRSELYLQGTQYGNFLDGVEKRREMWHTNDGRKILSDRLRERVRAIPGTWHLLAVAEDGCSDSANILPYLSVLLEEMDNLEIRIVDSVVGREVMEAHVTPDGRAATPTIVLLDGLYREAGAFVERPAELQKWALENRDALTQKEFMAEKFAWYDADRGAQTIDEVVALIEAAVQRIGD